MAYSVAHKWVKELIGLPTYIAATLLGMVVLDRGFIVTLLCVLFAAAVYNAIYEKIFPNYLTKGEIKKVLLVILSQVLIWGLIFVTLVRH